MEERWRERVGDPKLLRERHKEDLYVEECKDGATWNRAHYRLDGWAMAKSWSAPRMIGYEIKVSRGDFMRDDKWPNYLPLCNELYFVCPAKLIQPEEIPDKVGLIWAGGRLITKRKAAYREITPPTSLMTYILICRTKIDTEPVESPNAKAAKSEYYKKLVESKAFAEEVGSRLGGRLAREIDALHCENRRLKADQERISRVADEIRKFGLDPSWCQTHHIQRQAENMAQAFPPKVMQTMKRLAQELESSMSVISHYSNPERKP